MKLEIFSLWERPDLIDAVFAKDLRSVWPEFMRHDMVASFYYAPSVFYNYHEYAFAAVIDGDVVGRAFAVPFAFNFEGRMELPNGGWDQVIRWAHEDRMAGWSPTTMSALEIAFVPKARGRGNSLAMIETFKACARRKGFAEMFAPVRPNRKHLHPRMPMADYIEMKRPDGTLADPWLRTHVEAGGRIMRVAPYSMTIIGTIADWSYWTGRTFDHSGEIEVEGALAPVHVSLEQNHAIYVEPNVWVRHSTGL